MATTQAPPAARRNYLLSALISRRAVAEAAQARPRGVRAVASVVISHQIAQAQTSASAIEEMLLEQQIDVEAEALLNSAAFTTDVDALQQIIDQTETDFAFDRLVDSLVTEAARATESVAVAVRPRIYHVRFVNPPCCARCAVLAGRVYPWSSGFQRHPGCDCSMIPTTNTSLLWQDPMTLVEAGQVRGLSKADMRALNDGADLNRIVNIRRSQAGLTAAGRGLGKRGRPTPVQIYAAANGDRAKALRGLTAAGYIL